MMFQDATNNGMIFILNCRVLNNLYVDLDDVSDYKLVGWRLSTM